MNAPKIIARVVWLGVYVAILAYWLHGCSSASGDGNLGECHPIPLTLLAIAGFPISLVWLAALSAAAMMMNAAGVQLNLPLTPQIVGVWLGFVLLSYAQWFSLLPKGVSLLRARFRS